MFINERIIISVYVNDILLINLSKSKIQKIKNYLNQIFQIIDLKFVNYYLNMKITRDRFNRVIYLNQIKQVLKNHDM